MCSMCSFLDVQCFRLNQFVHLCTVSDPHDFHRYSLRSDKLSKLFMNQTTGNDFAIV